ncbi:hypothetical protein [Actinoplanes sp. NPDC049118]|uniref:hypothetical protein n=1 Tax=Actinoplanes sp. NPDC049118 TaxID=3155769 RepID=UPI0033F4A78B
MEAWPEVDELIVTNRIIEGIQVIRGSRECGIPTALDEFVERYRWLRENRPGDFTAGKESYWSGFYS